MIPQREDEHVKKGIKLLLEQFRNKPVITAWLASYLEGYQKFENDVWIVLWAWTLDLAVDGQLDDLGAIVGEPRERRGDEDYRAAIRVRIRVNRSKGRAEDVLQVARLLNNIATYVECFPLGWEVSIYNILNGGDIIRLLTQTKAASSYGVLLTSDWDEDEVFKFDYLEGQSVTASKLDYTVDAEVGFKMPAALPTNPPYRRST